MASHEVKAVTAVVHLRVDGADGLIEIADEIECAALGLADEVEPADRGATLQAEVRKAIITRRAGERFAYDVTALVRLS